MIQAEETFEGTFPFQPHFSEAAGLRMHYVDEGGGQPIVCLHGQPTWAYLYRRFIPALSGDHRVVVPDHMGFGKSETPQDREYTLRTHVENLAALVDELGLEDITLVMQDWGGPIGTAYTLRHPERVARLCFMNTVCGYGAAVDPDSARPQALRESLWFTWIASALEDGSYYEVLGNLGVTLPGVMGLIGFRNWGVVNNTWLRAYTEAFPAKEACKGAIEFPLDVALGRITPYVVEGFPMVDALRAKPAMLAEGMKDKAIPPELAIADFRALFPRAPVVELDDAGHYCQEDAPETLIALIQQFMQMT